MNITRFLKNASSYKNMYTTYEVMYLKLIIVIIIIWKKFLYLIPWSSLSWKADNQHIYKTATELIKIILGWCTSFVTVKVSGLTLLEQTGTAWIATCNGLDWIKGLDEKVGQVVDSQLLQNTVVWWDIYFHFLTRTYEVCKENLSNRLFRQNIKDSQTKGGHCIQR